MYWVGMFGGIMRGISAVCEVGASPTKMHLFHQQDTLRKTPWHRVVMIRRFRFQAFGGGGHAWSITFVEKLRTLQFQIWDFHFSLRDHLGHISFESEKPSLTPQLHRWSTAKSTWLHGLQTSKGCRHQRVQGSYFCCDSDWCQVAEVYQQIEIDGEIPFTSMRNGISQIYNRI